jgi:F420-non-reducing hydrogenase iron-sulfur subunit
MCTGRMDLAFVIRALQRGADGVIVGGCWPGECHYVTEGNYDALGNMHLCKMLLERVGVNPERLRLEWISAAEGGRFAEVMSSFTSKLRDLGPLGKGEGIEADDLKLKLDSMERVIPYAKLVEREKLRVPVRTEEAYKEFYASDSTKELIDDLIGQKLDTSQILTLLREGSFSTRDISERLGLSTSTVTRLVNDSSRKQLVTYDIHRKSYALA